MTNQEIINKLTEIAAKSSNFCDVVENLQAFDKTYKQTQFYKNTRMSLQQLFKNHLGYNLVNMEQLFKVIQEQINKLDLRKVLELTDSFAGFLTKETADLSGQIEELMPFINTASVETDFNFDIAEDTDWMKSFLDNNKK